MAFAGASLIADGKLCDITASPIDARADSGYHLLVVEGYSRSKGTTLTGQFINSRPFLVGGHRWILKYYPNGYNDNDEEFISVFLRLDNEVEGQERVSQVVEAQFAFSFIDQPELRVSTIVRRTEKFAFSFSDPSYGSHGLLRFMQKYLLERSRHLKNDSFVIRCDVVVIKADNNTEVQGAGTSTTAPMLIQLPPSDMQSHFDNLLFNDEGADITFEVGGVEFPAHRWVLAARSTVFKAQLFDEGATAASVVKINDMGTDVFVSLINFIYTDAFCGFLVSDTEDNMEEDEADKEEGMAEDEADEEEGDNTEDDEAEKEACDTEVSRYTMQLLQLLEAADRYNVQNLKSICEEILASREICMTSVADIIVVAERIGCRWLKEACMEFIKSHTRLHKVFAAECLDQIIRTTSPSGLKELFSKFAAS